MLHLVEWPPIDVAVGEADIAASGLFIAFEVAGSIIDNVRGRHTATQYPLKIAVGIFGFRPISCKVVSVSNSASAVTILAVQGTDNSRHIKVRVEIFIFSSIFLQSTLIALLARIFSLGKASLIVLYYNRNCLRMQL